MVAVDIGRPCNGDAMGAAGTGVGTSAVELCGAAVAGFGIAGSVF